MVAELRSIDGVEDGGAAFDSHLLLEHLITQGVAVLSRVLDRVVSDLTSLQDSSASLQQPAEDLVADAIADRITSLLSVPADSQTGVGEAFKETPEPDSIEKEYERLVYRNALLADALGACDCWGTAPDCPVCQGSGRSGWTNPDKRLFDEIVNPTLQAHERLKDDEPTKEDRNVSDGT